MSRYTITLGIPKPALPTGREEWQQSVQEMRAAVTRAQRDSNLVRQCNYRADLDGLNGEDRMTLIAYFALRALEDKVQQDVERLLLDPRPPVLKPAGGFDDD